MYIMRSLCYRCAQSIWASNALNNASLYLSIVGVYGCQASSRATALLLISFSSCCCYDHLGSSHQKVKNAIRHMHEATLLIALPQALRAFFLLEAAKDVDVAVRVAPVVGASSGASASMTVAPLSV